MIQKNKHTLNYEPINADTGSLENLTKLPVNTKMNWPRGLLAGSVGHLVYLMILIPNKQTNKKKTKGKREGEGERVREGNKIWHAVLGMGLSW